MIKQFLIEIYDKDETCETPFIKEIDISNYSLIKINKLCPPLDPFDYEYCGSLFLKEKEFNLLKKYVKELTEYDYNDFIYNLITRAS